MKSMLSINTKQEQLVRKELPPFSPLDMHSLHTPIDFDEECKITRIIHKNDISKTVLIKNLHNSGYSIAKIYDCHHKNRKKIKKIANKYWNQYQIVKYSGLNEYFRVFYDPDSAQLMIHQQCYQQTLSAFINTNGPVGDEHEIKVMAHGILMKLWRLHEYEYVHCNIKPSNIMERTLDHLYSTEFISDGWLLIDFDSMQPNGSKSRYKGCVGWSAPEIDYDSNKNIYTYSSDVFSFGLIIVYILTGHQPLEIPLDSMKEQSGMNLYGDIDKQDLMFPDTQQIVDKQLLKEKMERNWHYQRVVKSENLMKNYLVKLYYENKMSLHLFELLYDGLLVFDPDKRWNCTQIYDSNWFHDMKQIEKRTEN